MTITISALKDGPFVVSGDLDELQLTDANGAAFDFRTRRMVALCRCGASTTKPFCDGRHTKIGFEAAEAAVRDS